MSWLIKIVGLVLTTGLAVGSGQMNDAYRHNRTLSRGFEHGTRATQHHEEKATSIPPRYDSISSTASETESPASSQKASRSRTQVRRRCESCEILDSPNKRRSSTGRGRPQVHHQRERQSSTSENVKGADEIEHSFDRKLRGTSSPDRELHNHNTQLPPPERNTKNQPSNPSSISEIKHPEVNPLGLKHFAQNDFDTNNPTTNTFITNAFPKKIHATATDFGVEIPASLEQNTNPPITHSPNLHVSKQDLKKISYPNSVQAKSEVDRQGPPEKTFSTHSGLTSEFSTLSPSETRLSSRNFAVRSSTPTREYNSQNPQSNFSSEKEVEHAGPLENIPENKSSKIKSSVESLPVHKDNNYHSRLFTKSPNNSYNTKTIPEETFNEPLNQQNYHEGKLFSFGENGSQDDLPLNSRPERGFNTPQRSTNNIRAHNQFQNRFATQEFPTNNFGAQIPPENLSRTRDRISANDHKLGHLQPTGEYNTYSRTSSSNAFEDNSNTKGIPQFSSDGQVASERYIVQNKPGEENSFRNIPQLSVHFGNENTPNDDKINVDPEARKIRIINSTQSEILQNNFNEKSTSTSSLPQTLPPFDPSVPAQQSPSIQNGNGNSGTSSNLSPEALFAVHNFVENLFGVLAAFLPAIHSSVTPQVNRPNEYPHFLPGYPQQPFYPTNVQTREFCKTFPCNTFARAPSEVPSNNDDNSNHVNRRQTVSDSKNLPSNNNLQSSQSNVDINNNFLNKGRK